MVNGVGLYERTLQQHYHSIELKLRTPPQSDPEDEPICLVFPTIHKIIRTVSARERVSLCDLLSERRTKEIIDARMLVYYLASTLTNCSSTTIGRHIGGRDHSTVLSGRYKMARKRLENEHLDMRLKYYEKLLTAPA